MEKLKLNAILSENEGNQYEGFVYICECEAHYTTTNKFYCCGKFKDAEFLSAFKIWDLSIIETLQNFISNDERVFYVHGKVSVFNNQCELIVSSVDFELDATKKPAKTDFLGNIDIAAQWYDFETYIKQAFPPEYQNVVNILLSYAPDFETEFAAKSMHDAQAGGLLHHTFKMLRIFDILVYNDNRLSCDVLLYRIAIILHDLGKVKELHDGIYTLCGNYISHAAISEEILIRAYAKIKNVITDIDYLRLRAMIRGHHDAYGEPIKTADAYIIHLIDMLDSQTTRILNCRESKVGCKLNDNGLYQMKINDSYVVL